MKSIVFAKGVLWRAANGSCYFPPEFRESIIVGKWEMVRRGRAAWNFPEGEIDIDTRKDWEEFNDGLAFSETMPKGRRRRKVNYADSKR